MLSFMVAENNGKYIETRKNMYCEAHSRFIAKTPGLQHDNLRAVHRALKAAKGVASVDKKKESEPVSARPSMPVSSSGTQCLLVMSSGSPIDTGTIIELCVDRGDFNFNCPPSRFTYKIPWYHAPIFDADIVSPLHPEGLIVNHVGYCALSS